MVDCDIIYYGEGNMKIYACDPGANGALVLMDCEEVYKIIPFDKEEYVKNTHSLVANRCVLEKVHSMPKQGVVSTFNFGENYGWIRGVMDKANIKIIDVSPQKWKGYFHLSGNKEESIELCKKLYPNVNLFRTERCKKEHDGIAEAILIGRYYLETGARNED